MSISTDRGRIAKDVKLTHAQQVELAKTLKAKGYSNAGVAHIMRTSTSVVRILLQP